MKSYFWKAKIDVADRFLLGGLPWLGLEWLFTGERKEWKFLSQREATFSELGPALTRAVTGRCWLLLPKGKLWEKWSLRTREEALRELTSLKGCLPLFRDWLYSTLVTFILFEIDPFTILQSGLQPCIKYSIFTWRWWNINKRNTNISTTLPMHALQTTFAKFCYI